MPKADFAKLLDDFIGDREQLSWDLDAKRSRRLQIDDKFKFVRLQNGQFARLGPLENACLYRHRLDETYRQCRFRSSSNRRLRPRLERVNGRNFVTCS